tara:strand:- start:866 stop:1066 length:201 start_codon:yes stop_codon:yes gene_type:complete
MFNKRKLKKKKEISIILFLINIEISINNKDTITKTSKLIRAVEEIIERNNMLNPLLGLILFLIKPK